MTEVEFVGHIVTGITGDPECFKIEKAIDERGVLLTLHLDDNNMGRVVGRSGETANSIRGLLRALGLQNNAKYSLLIRKTGV